VDPEFVREHIRLVAVLPGLDVEVVLEQKVLIDPLKDDFEEDEEVRLREVKLVADCQVL
jgi:hypothetical protein